VKHDYEYLRIYVYDATAKEVWERRYNMILYSRLSNCLNIDINDY